MGLFSFFSKKATLPTEEDKINVKKNLDLALEYYKEKKYSEVQILLESVVAVDPSIAIAHAKLGGAYLNLNKIKKAKQSLEKAISLDDNMSDAHNNMGIVNISQNNLESAIKSFEKAISISPNDGSTMKNLAMCYLNHAPKKYYYYLKKAESLGDEEAVNIISQMNLRDLSKVNSLSISNEEKEKLLFGKKINYLFMEEKYSEVIELLNSFFEKEKNFNLDLMLNYILSLKRTKEFDKALYLTYTTLENLKEHKEQKDFYFLYILLGMLHCHNGQIKEASQFIQIAFQMNQKETKKFIIEENDELVKIEKNGYPSIKLPENYKEKLYENAKKDQLDRKSQTEKILIQNKVRVNEDLPLVVSEEDVTLRSVEEICQRVIGIINIALRAEGSEKAFTIFKEKFNSEKYFTEKEKMFLSLPVSDKTINAQFTWKYECVFVLLWALGYINDLTEPTKVCNAGKLVDIVMNLDNIEKFITESKLKSKSEILDQTDLIYRYDWACVHKRTEPDTQIGNIDPEIVFERHYAFNWLINFDNESWDNITTNV